MRELRFYDTRTRTVAPFEPRDAGKVGIYACGPTVYSRVHVGNARPFVVFSQLKRFLAHEGFDVTFVANITDINDKIYDAARAAGVPSAELAVEMGRWYVADTDRLGLGRPDAEPLATEYVSAIIGLIASLVERGHAYEASGDVYFRVRSAADYGALSRRDLDQMDQGEGVSGADLKDDPLDFALWKAAKPEEDTSWESPWGDGRPGWHIECSAMAEELLGLEFDIHGGGVDLVFPHHENEAAQTACGRGRPLARYWMHNGMLEFGAGGSKMSKSVGNVRGLAEVLDEVGSETLILYFSSGHYRQPIAFTDDRLEDAGRAAARIREAGRRLVPGPSPATLRVHRDAFFDALADDFNTARALGSLYEWVREANRLVAGAPRSGEAPADASARAPDGAHPVDAVAAAPDAVGDDDLREMLTVLGLETLLAASEGPPAELIELATARAAARERRDWAEADRLRDELAAAGWDVRDGPDGPELVPRA